MTTSSHGKPTQPDIHDRTQWFGAIQYGIGPRLRKEMALDEHVPSASGTWCTRWKKPSGNEKAEIGARMTRVIANMKLPADVHLHAPGTRPTVKTVEQASD